LYVLLDVLIAEGCVLSQKIKLMTVIVTAK